MKKFFGILVLLLITTCSFSQRLYNGVKPELVGTYLNETQLNILEINADTTISVPTQSGIVKYEVLCYSYNVLRRRTSFTLSSGKDNIALLQVYEKSDGKYMLVFLDKDRTEYSEVSIAQKFK